MPIALIIVGLLLVVGTVALAMSGTTWRWYQITLAALIMLLSATWFYLAARTLKIEQAWRSEIANWQKADREQDARREQLTKGGYTDAEGKEHPLALDRLQTQNLERLEARGRVWENVVRKGATPDGNLVVTIDKPEPPGIEPKTILTLFEDTPLGQEGQLLGQFEVVNTNGKDVQLAPVLKLRPSELQRIAQPRNAPLAMYEVMPADTHDFVQLLRDSAKDTMAKTPEQKEQVEKMDEATLVSKLLPPGIPDDVKLEYAKDGKSPAAGEGHPERVWQRFKVTKEISVPLSADEIESLKQRGEEPEKDAGGQPIKKIPEGTILTVDPQTARQLMASGNVEPDPDQRQVYVRPLRDYQRLYRELNLEIEELLRANAELNAQNEAIKTAQQKVEKDIAYRADEQQRLGRDHTHFVAENKLVKDHAAALEKELAQVKSQIDALLAANKQLEAQLVMTMHAAVDKINRSAQTADAKP
ncbi:MAG TPA: hypothetical protein VGI75_04290 [Pirellulales bacterium]|jgi:hypothetical protein